MPLKPKITRLSSKKDLPIKSAANTNHGSSASARGMNVDFWGREAQDQINSLMGQILPKDTPFENSDVVSEIIVTALKAAQSRIGRGDLKLLSRSIRELRYAFKIFKAYKDVRKVTIFGSARTHPNDPTYKLTKLFAKKIIQKGYMVITGAGPGIMQAGNEGAGPTKSFGVNIRLPFEQFPNKYIANEPTYIDCRYFFTRKLVFVKEASAGVFLPGGFGTLDEAFELLTLVQTGKCDPIPLIFMDTPNGHFWKDLQKFIENCLEKTRKISPEDHNLYRIVTSPEAGVKEIQTFYSNYHSIRYVDQWLVIRLQKPISDKLLAAVNKNFKDIIKKGSFLRASALKEEENQPEISHLPRLICQFNRVNNGRLRMLIDFLNKNADL